MQEFLILIQTEGDRCAAMTPEQYQQHLKKVSDYVARLTEEGKFVGAHPLQLGGAFVEGGNGVFKDGPFIESKEVIMGYYHVRATDLQEAVAIAKNNPLFEDFPATMEIRPVRKGNGIN